MVANRARRPLTLRASFASAGLTVVGGGDSSLIPMMNPIQVLVGKCFIAPATLGRGLQLRENQKPERALQIASDSLR